MAYEYIPKRTEKYAVCPELIEFCEEVDVEVKTVMYFDEEEQKVILDGIEEISPLIENSEGRHSAAYYQGVILADLIGFEDVDDDVRMVACQLALRKYRNEHKEEEPAPAVASILPTGLIFDPSQLPVFDEDVEDEDSFVNDFENEEDAEPRRYFKMSGVAVSASGVKLQGVLELGEANGYYSADICVSLPDGSLLAYAENELDGWNYEEWTECMWEDFDESFWESADFDDMDQANDEVSALASVLLNKVDEALAQADKPAIEFGPFRTHLLDSVSIEWNDYDNNIHCTAELVSAPSADEEHEVLAVGRNLLDTAFVPPAASVDEDGKTDEEIFVPAPVAASPVPAVPSAEQPQLLVVRGINDTIFSFSNDGEKFSMTAMDFGKGVEIPLFSRTVVDFADDGLADIELSEASFDWAEIEGIQDALDAFGDEVQFYLEAEGVFDYALTSMLGFKNAANGNIAKVISYDNVPAEEINARKNEVRNLLRKFGIKLDADKWNRICARETVEVEARRGAVEVNGGMLMDIIEGKDDGQTTEDLKKFLSSTFGIR